MSLYSECVARWNEQTKTIIAGGYFKKKRTAELFVVQRVAPAWSSELGASDDADVLRRFHVTSTQILILHLFGRGVHRVGVKGSSAPAFHAWPPSHSTREDGRPICRRFIPKRDIARMIGRSASAVQEALSRFKRSSGDDLLDHKLCNVLSNETGVVLDGIFERQAVFPFMYDVAEYAVAKQYAHEARVATSSFVARQDAWCKDALKAKGVTQLPIMTAARKEPPVSTEVAKGAKR